MYLLDNENVADYLGLDFTYDSSIFGQTLTRELIKGGQNIADHGEYLQSIASKCSPLALLQTPGTRMVSRDSP